MNKRPQFSVEQGFELFASRIELQLDDYTAISNKQADVETFLGQYISTFTTVLPGAFARRTLVTPLDNCSIDMYVLFKEEHSSRFTPKELLDKLLVTLKDRYEGTALSQKYNAVVLPFKDFEFRVQPGFLTDKKSYMIPANTGADWTNYDIQSYKEGLAKANSVHKGRLMPLIRMMKSWNHVNGNLFNDYYLELFVKERLVDFDITSYSQALCHLFDVGKHESAYKLNDPANLEFEVEGLLDVLELVNAMRVMQQAHRLANIAVKFEACGNSEQAFSVWRKLIPGHFPTDLNMIIAHIKNMNIKGAEALKLMQQAYESD